MQRSVDSLLPIMAETNGNTAPEPKKRVLVVGAGAAGKI
jgi:hypothetical protein